MIGSLLKTVRRIGTGRVLLTVLILCFLIGLIDNYVSIHVMLVENGGTLSRMLVIYSVSTFLIIGFFTLLIWKSGLLIFLNGLRQKLGWMRWVVAFIPIIVVCAFFFYTSWGSTFFGPYTHLAAFLPAFVVMAWSLTKQEDSAMDWEAILISILLIGTITTFAKMLSTVTDYPFSSTWSEGNRIWDYSIPFGRSLYEYPIDKPIRIYTDYARASLWGLPFLFPGVNIVLVRLWSVIVFTVPYAVLGWMLVGLRNGKKNHWFLFGLWSLLFLNLGPIYSPLVLAATLVAAIRKSPAWLSVILVVLASVYARAGRFSWMFAPGIWAFLLVFLQNPAAGQNRNWKRWGYAIGLAVAGFVGGYFIRNINFEWIVGSVGRQPLLWDRLWPNPTNSLGIVLGLLLATGPLITVLFYLYFSKKWRLDIWQALALAGGLGAFLVVGIVASVKIGGGGNLHNLDMFLIGLVFAAALAWENGGREWVCVEKGAPWWIRVALLAAMIYPAGQYMLTARPVGLPSMEKALAVLDEITPSITKATKSGEVLFMDQRQLLTFGYINKIPFVPDYEKKLVMDMAMSEDETYFDSFYKDLSAYRFSLIVCEPLLVKLQRPEEVFGDENDAWVKWVTIPILRYYVPIYTDNVVGIQVLRPRLKALPQTGNNSPIGKEKK